ncbi:hypothetical protein NDU88_004921 [Pleurodeles waltl]|uniref:Uncharacterized protein n=1 Tax=Pleurodeles waltl TaxID=8319 RepID=A0AAV7VK55_PLEWA|nr:hypothetical protein NDU88_004921 [Pleurodeles waltl]
MGPAGAATRHRRQEDLGAAIGPRPPGIQQLLPKKVGNHLQQEGISAPVPAQSYACGSPRPDPGDGRPCGCREHKAGHRGLQDSLYASAPRTRGDAETARGEAPPCDFNPRGSHPQSRLEQQSPTCTTRAN